MPSRQVSIDLHSREGLKREWYRLHEDATTPAGVLALLSYAVEADTDGEGWPSDLCAGDERGSWQQFLLAALAEILPPMMKGAAS